MTDPETPNQPLLAAPSQQASSAPGGRSTRAYKVAGITLLACVLIVSQVAIAYFLLSQRDEIKSLRDQSDNLETELTKGRSVAVPARMHMPMKALPELLAVSADEEASTGIPDKTVPQQATACQLEAAGVNRLPVPGFRPACDERGLYLAQQCFRQQCWCVNPANGQEIPGSLRTGKAHCGPHIFPGGQLLTLSDNTE